MRCGVMPTFHISVVNDDFIVDDDEEHPSADAAVEQAIKGALAVGSEAVLSGKMFFGAEVTVSNGSDRQRFMIAVGATTLK